MHHSSNEGESVSIFYEAVTAVVGTLQNVRFEVICADDGRTVDTLMHLLAAEDKDPRFVIMEWQQGAEVVVARRVDRSTDSFLKRTTARLFYRVNNNLSTVQIPEDVGDFQLMDRRAVDALKRLPARQRFMKGRFAWIGFKMTTLNYVCAPRTAGKAKFTGWRLWNSALEGITSFSTAPLKIWTYIGAISAIGALVYAAFIVVHTLGYGIDVPGYASVVVLSCCSAVFNSSASDCWENT